ncbi:MAG: threonine synthase [Nitrospinae bacterium]|nr:threonine synthase [Nitrospinota bacterium]
MDLLLPVPQISPEVVQGRPADLWRYVEALPPLTTRVSLGESMTPFIPFEHRGRTVCLKCDYLLPTGSYKDRGAAMLVSHLKAMGVRRAVEDSSGNAAASLAAYAARAEIEIEVFCPASASPGKLTQIQLYGAKLRLIEGSRQRTTEALEQHVAATGDFYASHLWHPYFLEGIKTMAFEIAEQNGWRAPGAVICPVGAGSILLGLHKGFRELKDAGVIDRLPRLFAAQAANICPLYRAYTSHDTDVPPIEAPQPTLAEGIALPRPVRGPLLLQALRETNGGVAAVSEEEIREGLVILGRRGICVEPTSAVVVKALEHLEDAKVIHPPEQVVLVLSGFGLKASSALQQLVGAG